MIVVWKRFGGLTIKIFYLYFSLFAFHFSLYSQPPEAERLFDQAAEKFLNQDWAGATADMEKVIKLDPGNEQALNLLCRAYARWAVELKAKKRFTEAVKKIKRAKELLPGHKEVLAAEKEVNKSQQKQEEKSLADKLRRQREDARRKKEQRAREFGDLLFTLVNIARREDIDLEAALREANQRFYKRFTYMEELCRQCGVNFGELSFAKQNALWDEAKRKAE